MVDALGGARSRIMVNDVVPRVGLHRIYTPPQIMAEIPHKVSRKRYKIDSELVHKNIHT